MGKTGSVAVNGPDHKSEAPTSVTSRLRAWWDGSDRPEVTAHQEHHGAAGNNGHAAPDAAKAAAAPVPVGGPGLDRTGQPLWNAHRITVAERIWGAGFATPGGDDHIRHLVEPLGLNLTTTVLDLSAGLGGATRFLATKYGVAITGLEASEALVQAAQARSVLAGLAKKAPIHDYDPEDFHWTHPVNAIFAKEAFCFVRHKDKLLDAVAACLKPGGQILFTDYVVDAQPRSPDQLKVWMGRERQEPMPWTPEQMTDALKKRRLDVRLAEDMTATQRTLILHGALDLSKHLDAQSLDRVVKLAMVDEVELWARRMTAMESGLKVYRFRAVKPTD